MRSPLLASARLLLSSFIAHAVIAWTPEKPPAPRPMPSNPLLSRSSVLLSLLTTVAPTSALAFEGGVGGLGKTKPETGVVFFREEPPSQGSDGSIRAEVVVGKKPVLVAFTAPYPLAGAGLEARDRLQPESAFVQVVDGVKQVPQSKAAVKQLLLETVLSQQGKFGAYGAVTDVKVKALDGRENLYSLTFTTLTPGLRESDREALVLLASPNEGGVLILMTGTTRNRFAAQEGALRGIVDSFVAVAAP